MKPITLLIAAAIALALTVAPGWYHGQRTFRWGTDTETRGLAQRLQEFPEEILGWRTVATLQLQQEEVDQLQPTGYIARTYAMGEFHANIFVLIGPTGPTAVHTPDICFSSRDYRSLGPRKQTRVEESAINRSECWLTQFQSNHVNQHCMKAWYAWTTDGQWHASENPRYDFADSRYLVKLQISVFYPDSESMKNDKTGDEFVKIIAERLTKDLFAGLN